MTPPPSTPPTKTADSPGDDGIAYVFLPSESVKAVRAAIRQLQKAHEAFDDSIVFRRLVAGQRQFECIAQAEIELRAAVQRLPNLVMAEAPNAASAGFVKVPELRYRNLVDCFPVVDSASIELTWDSRTRKANAQMAVGGSIALAGLFGVCYSGIVHIVPDAGLFLPWVGEVARDAWWAVLPGSGATAYSGFKIRHGASDRIKGLLDPRNECARAVKASRDLMREPTRSMVAERDRTASDVVVLDRGVEPSGEIGVGTSDPRPMPAPEPVVRPVDPLMELLSGPEQPTRVPFVTDLATTTLEAMIVHEAESRKWKWERARANNDLRSELARMLRVEIQERRGTRPVSQALLFQEKSLRFHDESQREAARRECARAAFAIDEGLQQLGLADIIDHRMDTALLEARMTREDGILDLRVLRAAGMLAVLRDLGQPSDLLPHERTALDIGFRATFVRVFALDVLNAGRIALGMPAWTPDADEFMNLLPEPLRPRPLDQRGAVDVDSFDADCLEVPTSKVTRRQQGRGAGGHDQGR